MSLLCVPIIPTLTIAPLPLLPLPLLLLALSESLEMSLLYAQEWELLHSPL